ncbi:hypothetical protein V8E36_004283 [Tilletia maclaganii]
MRCRVASFTFESSLSIQVSPSGKLASKVAYKSASKASTSLRKAASKSASSASQLLADSTQHVPASRITPGSASHKLIPQHKKSLSLDPDPSHQTQPAPDSPPILPSAGTTGHWAALLRYHAFESKLVELHFDPSLRRGAALLGSKLESSALPPVSLSTSTQTCTP